MKFKRIHLEEVITFAMNNIPQADLPTLALLMELVMINQYEDISYDELLGYMERVLIRLPMACLESLGLIMDLLDLCPSYLALVQPHIRPIMRLQQIRKLGHLNPHQVFQANPESRGGVVCN